MAKKKIKQAIVILVSLFLCVTLILGAAISLVYYFGARVNILKAFAAEASSGKAVMYLSDMDAYKSENFESGRPLIKDATDANGTKMQVKIEGAWYTFDKGLFTHTNSSKSFVSLYYNIENLDYQYFTAYVGLNKSATKGDGAGFNVGTSVDGTNWTWIVQSPQLIGPQAEAQFITVDISGAKYLRLYVSRGANNAHDHAVWADAKLTNSLGDGAGDMPIESFDAQIKAYGVDANLNDPKFELLLLQREFVSRVGQYALKRFRSESLDNTVMLDWLLNDLDSLREFMLGGAPFKGNYYNSLTVLAKLYKSYKKDLDDKTLLNNKFAPNRTFGELCRTMMFSVALTHDGTIGSYLQGSKEVNQSQPNRRYAIFKYMYQTNRFVATSSYETMTMFGSLKVEEMRYIMSNIIDDESIIWLNDYVQTRINANPKNAGNLHTPHSYVRYTDPNYGNPVFYDPENHEYFNNLFAVDGRTVSIGDKVVENNAGTKIGMFDTKYIVPAGDGEEPYEIKISYSLNGEPNIQKVWMNFNNKFKTGSVCGGISKSGTNIRTARGVPAHVIGQPGHAAILYYGKDANGNGSWKIDNDVGGWLAATKGERHLLGWGSDAAWQRNSSGTVVYFHLAQACLNDYDNLVKAEEYCWLAKVYKGDLDAQEKLYEKALQVQGMNLDAWYGLLTTYKANNKKTVADYCSLTSRIADKYWNHPVPMHCLFRLLTDVDATTKKIVGVTDEVTDATLKNPAFTMQIKAVEMSALEKAKASGSSAAKSKVNWIIGASDMDVADFSFDGDNAGCIVWSDTYSDGSFVWKYSLDGKKTWKEVTFNEGDSHAYQLTENELSSLTAENGIYVYIVGASEANAYKINLAARPVMPDTLYANDWENRVIGVDGTYEWRYVQVNDDGDYEPMTGWIGYASASPDCTGDKAVEVRLKGTAKKPASEPKIFMFTADKDTEERKYISVTYLTIEQYSTQSQDAKRPNYAVNAIDGNAKTYWHTDYAKSIKASLLDDKGNIVEANKPYLTIKLEVARWISALEFSQCQYNSSFSIFAKNVSVYVSEDGENWTLAGSRTNLENVEDLYAIHFEEAVYGKYVKLVMDSLHETNKNDGVFTTVSLINLYEDTRKKLSPTNETMQSLSEIQPSYNKFSGLGEIISEEKALEIGGEPTEDDDPFGEIGFPGISGVPGTPGVSGTPSGTETPGDDEPTPKSLVGLWITLAVVGVVLVAAAVVFVLYKRGIIKIGGKENTDKGSKPAANTAESEVKTTKAKTNAVESKAKDTKASESKANATKAKTNTVESTVSATKAKADTAKSASNAAKPKTDASATKVKDTKPKTDTAEPKAKDAKAKSNSTESKVKAANSKTGTAESQVKATKPKTNPGETKSNAAKPKNK